MSRLLILVALFGFTLGCGGTETTTTETTTTEEADDTAATTETGESADAGETE